MTSLPSLVDDLDYSRYPRFHKISRERPLLRSDTRSVASEYFYLLCAIKLTVLYLPFLEEGALLRLDNVFVCAAVDPSSYPLNYCLRAY